MTCPPNADVIEVDNTGSEVSRSKSQYQNKGPIGDDAPYPDRDICDMCVPTDPLQNGDEDERRGANAQQSQTPTVSVNDKGRGLGLANTQTTFMSHCSNSSGKRYMGQESRKGRINKIRLTQVSNPEVSQSKDVSHQMSLDTTVKHVQTKPMSEGENLGVEGRIAQYSQCSNPKDTGVGRGLCEGLVDMPIPNVSRNHSPLMHASVRVCYLENGDNLMKHSSNISRREEIE